MAGRRDVTEAHFSAVPTTIESPQQSIVKQRSGKTALPTRLAAARVGGQSSPYCETGKGKGRRTSSEVPEVEPAVPATCDKEMGPCRGLDAADGLDRRFVLSDLG